jgi:hypothetical protein
MRLSRGSLSNIPVNGSTFSQDLSVAPFSIRPGVHSSLDLPRTATQQGTQIGSVEIWTKHDSSTSCQSSFHLKRHCNDLLVLGRTQAWLFANPTLCTLKTRLAEKVNCSRNIDQIAGERKPCKGLSCDLNVTARLKYVVMGSPRSRGANRGSCPPAKHDF